MSASHFSFLRNMLLSARQTLLWIGFWAAYHKTQEANGVIFLNAPRNGRHENKLRRRWIRNAMVLGPEYYRA